MAEELKMLRICLRARNGSEVNRRIVSVKRTAKRIKVLNSYEPKWFSHEGNDLSRDRFTSMYRYRLEPMP